MPFTPEEEHQIRNMLAMQSRMQEILVERESKKWLFGFLKGTAGTVVVMMSAWIFLRDVGASMLEFLRGPGR